MQTSNKKQWTNSCNNLENWNHQRSFRRIHRIRLMNFMRNVLISSIGCESNTKRAYIVRIAWLSKRAKPRFVGRPCTNWRQQVEIYDGGNKQRAHCLDWTSFGCYEIVIRERFIIGRSMFRMEISASHESIYPDKLTVNDARCRS